MRYIVLVVLALAMVLPMAASAQSAANSDLTPSKRRGQQEELISDSLMTGTRISQPYTMRRGVDSISVFFVSADTSDVSIRIRSLAYVASNALVKSDTTNIWSLATASVKNGASIRSIPWYLLKRAIESAGAGAMPLHWRFEVTFGGATPSYGTVSLSKYCTLFVKEYVH